MHKNNGCTIDTLKYLIRTVSLLLQAHFIKPRLNVRYRNLRFALNVGFIAVFRLIAAADKKPASHNTMLQIVQEFGELYTLQVEIQVEP